MENDDNLLLYNVEEGLKIEPVWYAPIIPMVLVNGAEGIGTGWSTSVPEYNPIDLAQNLIRKIRGENMEKMIPWYKGFHGKIMESIDNKGNTTYISNGIINIDEEKEIVEISELPVKEFTRDYKTFLEKNHVDNKEYTGKKDFIIEDIKEYHIDNRISFVLKLSDDSFNYIKRLSNDDLIKLFKLTSNLPTTNMVLFDSKNKIKKYNNVEEIINEFYEVRLDYYKQRKNYLLAKVGFALEKNKNKKKFINMVLEGDLPFKGTKNKKEVFKLLQSKGFTSLNELKKTYSEAFKVKSTEIVIENNNDNKEDVLDYDYLMNMNIWSLTHEKVNELEETIKNQTAEYDFLSKSKPEDLWIKDLEDFITVYKKVVNNLDEKNKEAENKIKETRSKVKIKQKRKNKKTKNDIKNKNKDSSFITDSVNSRYSVYSSSSSVSSEEDLSEEDGNYTIYSESSNKKTKTKNKNKKEKMISLDEEEEESDRKKNIENISIESNLKLERIKKSLTQSEQKILAEIGVKQIKETNDPSKLTLRERLALRVAKGNLGNIPKTEYKIPIKPNINTNEDLNKELDIKEVEELLDNDFLGKKTKPSTKKLTSGKKEGKASTKKKKVIEDSEDIEIIDDDDDEEFKL
jgi:DNA topoisomerase-2